MQRVLISVLLFISTLQAAKPRSIYDLAQAYKAAAHDDFNYMNNLGTAFKYFEFKGYVRAVLDSSHRYDKCKELLPVKEIAKRAAFIISSSQNGNDYISASVAVDMSCKVKYK